MNAEDVRKLVREKYAILGADDHFALLGVAEDASTEDVKDAYFRLVKVLHPDRLQRVGVTDCLAEANQVFRGLTTAYNTLTDKKTRAAYVAHRQGGDAGPDESALASAVSEDVRIYAHRGELMLKRRAYAEAETFFRKALELAPKEPHIHVKLGTAIFYNEQHPKGPREEEARALWEKAQDMADNRAEALYHLAIYWKAKGDLQKVEDHLRDALTLQPGYVEAKREFRLLVMRRRNAKKKGIFEKLAETFKRKQKK